MYETGKVEFSKHDLGRFITSYNTHYSEQWALNNTGQSGDVAGVDINIESAWDITAGRDIKIAVLDEGVDLTYDDLIVNLLSGYDTTGENSNGGYQNSKSHGTNCAGIISATDNNIGVKSIAYNSNIVL